MRKKEYIKPTMEKVTIFCNGFSIGMSGKTGNSLFFNKPNVDRHNYPEFENIV